MSERRGLSKSRISGYLQCPKRLWLEVHRPELKEQDARTESTFAAGHSVGDVARAQYPNGVLVGHDTQLSAAIEETKQLLRASARRPVFEGTFQHESVLVRADLLLPTKKGWHMAEVKSSAAPKPYHVDDLAIQTWVARGSGLPITRATIRHIDTSFVYPGNGKYKGLLMDSSLGPELKERASKVPEWVGGAQSVLAGKEPRRDVGPHCNEPFDCPFTGYCSKGAPAGPKFPVTLLPGKAGKKLAAELLAEGMQDLTKVPADRMPNEKLARIHQVTISKIAHTDPNSARSALRSWKYPRAFLDFETISFAIPIWQGTRPYEQIPFQWSCHIAGRNGELHHREFLDLSGANPTRRCAEELVRVLGPCKTVVSYSAGTERGVIRRLADACRDLRAELNAIADRVQDLLPIVRDTYYHHEMYGSYSIKAVLPTLAKELDYEKLGEVRDGMAAQVAYQEAISPETPPERKAQIASDLQRYCALDSMAMVAVSRALAN
jgi:hypothetical protein